MRVFALIMILAMSLLAGCQTSAQTVYDERAEQECYEVMNAEAQRACLDEVQAGTHRRE